MQIEQEQTKYAHPNFSGHSMIDHHYNQNVNNDPVEPIFMRHILKQRLSLNQLVEADLIQTLVFDQDGSGYIQSKPPTVSIFSLF